MKSNLRIIRKIALGVFKDKKMMMVRSFDEPLVFFTLGGTVKEGEEELACLKREVFEEIRCQIDEKSLDFISEFEFEAHGKKNTLVNIKLYKGNLIGAPKPSGEVVEIDFFDTKTDPKHLSTMAKIKIFPHLKEKGYIN